MGHLDEEETSNTTPATSRPIPTYPRAGGSTYPRYEQGSTSYGSLLSEVETVSNPDDEHSVYKERWFISLWRPAMAWLYFAICAFDFICAPIFMFWFAAFAGKPYIAWVPLTLQGGGLIHISLGAIIGVYAWSRTREKLAGVSSDEGYYRRRI